MGCSETYLGKTVRSLRTRLSEHAKFNSSVISEHLTTCEHAKHVTDLHNLYDNVNDIESDRLFTNHELITKNTKRLYSKLYNVLLFLEALRIKFKTSALNNGLKVLKKLVLSIYFLASYTCHLTFLSTYVIVFYLCKDLCIASKYLTASTMTLE